MDKDFAGKLKKKRARRIALVVILIAVVALAIKSTRVEKADYGESLNKAVSEAETLYKDGAANKGNGSGQYAEYTLLTFKGQLDSAKKTASDKNSTYNQKKAAYESIKTYAETFRKSANSDVISAKDAKAMKKTGEDRTLKVGFARKKSVTYKVKADNIDSPRDMNFMAVGEGPYYDEILSYVSTLKLQGQVISFCQNGSFGAKIGATVPIYAKSAKVCFIYKYDHKDKKLTYCGAGTVDLDAQTASFSISEGGDYVILLKSLEKTTTKVQRDNASDASAKTSKDTGSKTSADNSSASGNGSGSTSGGKTDKYVTVTIEIRCDTISSDTSKISNESIKKYIPSDGTIMAETKVKVKEGSTVYDVLNQQCRDKNIQLDAKYTPVYGSYYVEGINYIYEFDAGDLSGWEYRVNGYYPNYGSSEYKVKDGDKIVWAYTCDLGKDIGDNVND